MYDFLFVIFEHFRYLVAYTVDTLQGKTCQTSLLSGEGGHLEPRFQGERVVPREYFLLFAILDTFCYLTVCSRFDTIPACDRQKDRCTDGRTDRRTELP